MPASAVPAAPWAHPSHATASREPATQTELANPRTAALAFAPGLPRAAAAARASAAIPSPGRADGSLDAAAGRATMRAGTPAIFSRAVNLSQKNEVNGPLSSAATEGADFRTWAKQEADGMPASAVPAAPWAHPSHATASRESAPQTELAKRGTAALARASAAIPSPGRADGSLDAAAGRATTRAGTPAIFSRAVNLSQKNEVNGPLSSAAAEGADFRTWAKQEAGGMPSSAVPAAPWAHPSHATASRESAPQTELANPRTAALALAPGLPRADAAARASAAIPSPGSLDAAAGRATTRAGTPAIFSRAVSLSQKNEVNGPLSSAATEGADFQTWAKQEADGMPSSAVLAAPWAHPSHATVSRESATQTELANPRTAALARAPGLPRADAAARASAAIPSPNGETASSPAMPAASRPAESQTASRESAPQTKLSNPRTATLARAPGLPRAAAAARASAAIPSPNGETASSPAMPAASRPAESQTASRESATKTKLSNPRTATLARAPGLPRAAAAARASAAIPSPNGETASSPAMPAASRPAENQIASRESAPQRKFANARTAALARAPGLPRAAAAARASAAIPSPNGETASSPAMPAASRPTESQASGSLETPAGSPPAGAETAATSSRRPGRGVRRAESRPMASPAPNLRRAISPTVPAGASRETAAPPPPRTQEAAGAPRLPVPSDPSPKPGTSSAASEFRSPHKIQGTGPTPVAPSHASIRGGPGRQSSTQTNAASAPASPAMSGPSSELPPAEMPVPPPADDSLRARSRAVVQGTGQAVQGVRPFSGRTAATGVSANWEGAPSMVAARGLNAVQPAAPPQVPVDVQGGARMPTPDAGRPTTSAALSRAGGPPLDSTAPSAAEPFSPVLRPAGAVAARGETAEATHPTAAYATEPSAPLSPDSGNFALTPGPLVPAGATPAPAEPQGELRAPVRAGQSGQTPAPSAGAAAWPVPVGAASGPPGQPEPLPVSAPAGWNAPLMPGPPERHAAPREPPAPPSPAPGQPVAALCEPAAAPPPAGGDQPWETVAIPAAGNEPGAPAQPPAPTELAFQGNLIADRGPTADEGTLPPKTAAQPAVSTTSIPMAASDPGADPAPARVAAPQTFERQSEAPSEEHSGAPRAGRVRQPESPSAAPGEPAAGALPVQANPSRAPAQPGDPAGPPEPPSAASRIAPEPPPPAAPRDIRLELTNGDQRVEVLVADRGGDVHVAVRTSDTHLAGALREDLPALSARLEQSGLRAEAWHTQTPAGDGRPEGERPPLSSAGDPHGQPGQDPRGQPGDSQRRPSPQAKPGPQDQPQQKEKGKEFAWFMSSLG